MRFNIMVIFLLLFYLPLKAQMSCDGIPVASSAQDEIFNGGAMSSITNKFVKIYFHVYDNNGSDSYSIDDLDDLINDLNGYFSSTSFSFFYSPCEVRYDGDLDLYNSIDRCDFFNVAKHDDGIDVHLKGGGASYLGVASGIPGSELVIGGYHTDHGVKAAYSPIFAHEMGHALGLLHTFAGTCNQKYTICGVPGEFWTGTDPQGDYVSDTEEDFNSDYTNVNNSCEWNGQGCADDGQEPTHLIVNYMSYTRMSCMSEFTSGQNAKMCSDALPDVLYDAPVGPFVADYKITNNAGGVQDEFCVNETILLDGSTSEGEEMYSIEIFEYNLGGYSAGEAFIESSVTNPEWISGQVGNSIDLLDIWLNDVSYDFRQGFEYRVVLKVTASCDDAIVIKEDGIFTILKPTPDYIYTDIAGNPKSEFCFGERVFLDGSASFNDDKYFLAIWQYVEGTFDPDNPGSNNTGYSRLDPSWAQGEVPEKINLLSVWDNFGEDFFAPGYEYAVQLAVQNDCDQGWYSKFDASFSVVCCTTEDGCSADFKLEENGATISLDANIERPYASHNWQIAYSANSPLPEDLQEVANSNASGLTFELTEAGYYVVQHVVTTPCGSCCKAKLIEAIVGVSGELVFEISDMDCINTDEYCNLSAPKNPTCSTKDGLLELIWDPVVDAISYTIIATYNDPDCCVGGSEPFTRIYTTQEESYTFDFSPRCMSWMVRANCPDGVRGPLSEKQCLDSSCRDGKLKGETDSEISKRVFDASNEVEVYPNPAANQVNIDIGSRMFEDGVLSLELYDISGKRLMAIDSESLRKNDSHTLQIDQLENGIYFISIKTSKDQLSKKLMIIQ